MTKPWEALNDNDARFREVVRERPGDVLLALDFDGTLAYMVPDPNGARLYDGSARALANLGKKLGKIAIVTGRAVATVKSLGQLEGRPGLESATVLGQYGVERWDAATGELRDPEPPAAVEEARRALVRMLAELASQGRPVGGVHLEDKGRGIGVHTRRADDPDGAMTAIDGPTRDIAAQHDLIVEPGRSVIELRSSNHTKADAIRELGSELRPAAVAMVGDDLGDLPAFQLLESMRGKGIVTCNVLSASDEQPSLREHVDVICDGVGGVAEWLASLTE